MTPAERIALKVEIGTLARALNRAIEKSGKNSKAAKDIQERIDKLKQRLKDG